MAEEQARLVYVRGDGAAQCPAELDLRLWVIARLGYDPFSPRASRVVLARIEAKADSLQGRVELVDAQGLSKGLRSLTSTPERCDELARAMALSISLAIDPERASAASVAPASAAPMTAAPPNTPDVGSLPASPPASRPATPAARVAEYPQLAAGAVAALGAGALPGAVFGGLAFGSWRERRWSATIEARVLGSSGKALPGGGRLFGTLLGAGAALCLELGQKLSACAVATVATQRLSSADVPNPGAMSGFFAGLGPRLAWRAPLGRHTGLSLAMEGLVDTSRNAARYSGAEVWRAPLLSGLGLVGIDALFL